MTEEDRTKIRRKIVESKLNLYGESIFTSEEKTFLLLSQKEYLQFLRNKLKPEHKHLLAEVEFDEDSLFPKIKYAQVGNNKWFFKTINYLNPNKDKELQSLSNQHLFYSSMGINVMVYNDYGFFFYDNDAIQSDESTSALNRINHVNKLGWNNILKFTKWIHSRDIKRMSKFEYYVLDKQDWIFDPMYHKIYEKLVKAHSKIHNTSITINSIFPHTPYQAVDGGTRFDDYRSIGIGDKYMDYAGIHIFQQGEQVIDFTEINPEKLRDFKFMFAMHWYTTYNDFRFSYLLLPDIKNDIMETLENVIKNYLD